MVGLYWEMRNTVNIVQSLIYRPSREETENLIYSMFQLLVVDKVIGSFQMTFLCVLAFCAHINGADWSILVHDINNDTDL